MNTNTSSCPFPIMLTSSHRIPQSCYRLQMKIRLRACLPPKTSTAEGCYQ